MSETNDSVINELENLNQANEQGKTEKKPRKPGSGRPKGAKNKVKNEVNQDASSQPGNNDFKPIDDYKKENLKTEIADATQAPLENILNASPENSNLVKIKLDAKNLVMAEIFIDSILQKILNAIGFKIELEPMSENDLKIWAELAPEMKLEKSWPNFFKFYLLAKAKN